MSTTIDLTKTVKEIITSIKSAIDSLNTDVASNKSAIDSLKSEILLAAHPVGSYYFSDDSTDPGTLFGGTWKALPAGYGVVAQGTAKAEDGSTLTFTAGSKYGEFKHQLTVGELPYPLCRSVTNSAWHPVWESDVNLSSIGCSKHDSTVQSYINNISPVVTTYGWHRTV